ncbi:MAG: ACT domain-containing protein, partial [Candidatus Thermoplasmatota archaeon]|nr:ACT domain-containing protein [Candidatus Thermoplasmatota archaeon]
MTTTLTVLMENRPGALSQVTGVLAKAGVNVDALMVEAEHDFGYARLQCHPLHEAQKALEEAGFQVRKGSVLSLKLANEPGTLHDVLSKLAGAGINVEFLFGTAAEGDTGEL